MQIHFRNTKIYYRTTGRGTPIVLLHGFLESGEIWNQFSAEFAEERKIINIDLPGHGKSGNISEVHTMELMAEVVFHVLQAEKITNSDFLGHSMGGYVALAFLEKYPEVVKKLILLNSTPEADSPEREENRDRAISLIKLNKSTFISMAISNLLLPENNKKFKKEIEELKNRALQFPTEGIIASLKGMKNREDRQQVLKRFAGKKIVIAGKQDPLLDYEVQKNIAEANHCDFFTMPDGHLGYLENQQDFFRIVHLIE